MTSPIVDPYCRACKTALATFTEGATGNRTYLHELQPPDGHEPDPVALAELPDALMRCDFCGATEVRWVYPTANVTRTPRVITSQTVGASDYRDRHGAARVRSVQTAKGITSNLGSDWAACNPCADTIEARDLMGLMQRAVDGLPRKATNNPRRLAAIRGQMRAVYEPLLETLGERTAVPPGAAGVTP